MITVPCTPPEQSDETETDRIPLESGDTALAVPHIIGRTCGILGKFVNKHGMCHSWTVARINAAHKREASGTQVHVVGRMASPPDMLAMFNSSIKSLMAGKLPDSELLGTLVSKVRNK